MFDLVIRDALLIDGLGSPPCHGGVAVKDGRIAEVGRILGSSKETVVAEVCP
jgi:N-acyl-D-aspartate/D-glutamate deacylase